MKILKEQKERNMEGDKRVDELMWSVKAAIERHVKDRDAFTDIYDSAFDAIMKSVDGIDDLIVRVEAAEARIYRLRNMIQLLLDHVDYTSGACRVNEMIGAVLETNLIRAAHELLREGDE